MPTSQSNFHCAAILVAAGSSQRMGFDKLAVALAGIPVLQRTLQAFLDADSIAAIWIVCPPERWELLDHSCFSKPVTRVDGGSNRQDSVAAGLAMLSSPYDFVAVHDGARALILPSEVDRCVTAAGQHHAVALARRVQETLKRSDSEDFSTESVSRSQLWFMETPQVFKISLLREAYRFVAEQSLTVTDEVSALESIGVPVKLIESRYPNLKITTPADLALATALIS